GLSAANLGDARSRAPHGGGPCTAARGVYVRLVHREVSMRRAMFIALGVAAVAGAPRFAASQQFTRPGPITRLSAPAGLDTTGLFQGNAAKFGEDIFVTGQPTQRALRELKAQGV